MVENKTTTTTTTTAIKKIRKQMKIKKMKYYRGRELLIGKITKTPRKNHVLLEFLKCFIMPKNPLTKLLVLRIGFKNLIYKPRT